MDISNEHDKPNLANTVSDKIACKYGISAIPKTQDGHLDNGTQSPSLVLNGCNGDDVRPLRERKFFKTTRVHSPRFRQNGVKTNLGAEDISKFFNLPSKTFITPVSSEGHTGKSSLKTYKNPRKIFKEYKHVVESFGLPDEPIVADDANVYKFNGLLDVNCAEASETTILEMCNLEDSWRVTDYQIGGIFNSVEAIRVKSATENHNVGPNSFEALDKLFTSTPYVKDKDPSENKNLSEDDTTLINGQKLHENDSIKTLKSNLKIFENRRPLRSYSLKPKNGNTGNNSQADGSTSEGSNPNCSNSIVTLNQIDGSNDSRKLQIVLRKFDNENKFKSPIRQSVHNGTLNNLNLMSDKINAINLTSNVNSALKQNMVSAEGNLNEAELMKEGSVSRDDKFVSLNDNTDDIKVNLGESKREDFNIGSSKKEKKKGSTKKNKDGIIKDQAQNLSHSPVDLFKNKLRTKFEGIISSPGKVKSASADDKTETGQEKTTNSSKSIEVSLQLLQILPCNKDLKSQSIQTAITKPSDVKSSQNDSEIVDTETSGDISHTPSNSLLDMLHLTKGDLLESEAAYENQKISEDIPVEKRKVFNHLVPDVVKSVFKKNGIKVGNELINQINSDSQTTELDKDLVSIDLNKSDGVETKKCVRSRKYNNALSKRDGVSKVKSNQRTKNADTSSEPDKVEQNITTPDSAVSDLNKVEQMEVEKPRKMTRGRSQERETRKSDANQTVTQSSTDTAEKFEVTNSSLTHSIEINTDSSNGVISSTPKKKVGRPRKKAIDNPVKSLLDETKSTDKNSKLSGGPLINSIDKGSETVMLSPVTITDVAEEIIPSVLKRKRGRPRKNLINKNEQKDPIQSCELEFFVDNIEKSEIEQSTTTDESSTEDQSSVQKNLSINKQRSRKKKFIDQAGGSIKQALTKIDCNMMGSIDMNSELEISFFQTRPVKKLNTENIETDPATAKGPFDEKETEDQTTDTSINKTTFQSFRVDCEEFSKSIDKEISSFETLPFSKQKLRSRSSLGERYNKIEPSKGTTERPSRKNAQDPHGSRIRSRSESAWSAKDIRKAEELQEFKLGALAWGQLGKYPFWPCLITKEPAANLFKKEDMIRSTKCMLYHVRFFGDNGRRAWIRAAKLKPYSGKDDLETFYRSLLFSDISKAELLFYKVRKVLIVRWTEAVEEADSLKSKSVKDRFKFFQELFDKAESDATSKKLHKLESEVKEKTISDIKQPADNFEVVEANVSPSKKKLRSQNIVKQDLKKRKLVTDIEEENEPQLRKKAKRDEMSISGTSLESRSSKRLLKSEPSTSQDNNKIEGSSDIKPPDTEVVIDSETLETQRQLFKRNNLFRGITKEKVCHYCVDGGDVYKCTGQCNGWYHSHCAADLTGWVSQKLKPTKASPGRKRKLDFKDEPVIQENLKIENMVQNNTVEEHSEEESPDESIQPSTVLEERVQIITVPSSIYNTPPKKVFPPDFENMSLAEQIDYKMKEVMKKFEAGSPRSHYTPLESSSDEKETSPKLTLHQLKKEKNEKTKSRISKYVSVDHVTAESLLEQDSPPTPNKSVTDERLKTDSLEAEHLNSSCGENKLSVHRVNPKTFKCRFCINKIDPPCSVCHLEISSKGSVGRQKCNLYWCGKFYHPECLKVWPQTQFSVLQPMKSKNTKEDLESFMCPQHVCHICASGNPRAALGRCSWDKTVRCLLCPSAYHSSNFCLPAGSEILSTTQIICPRHRKNNAPTINTTWCFLCSEGGNLICCETCPTSVHPECLPVVLTEDNKFICEDCESGRLPLYDEIVWVKLGHFRWWPGVILYPNEVPTNVMNMKHSVGDFVVRFFGTYDHYWVHRGKAFLFQDGDTACGGTAKGKYDEVFNKSVEEAITAHKLKIEFKQNQENESLNSQKPPHYIRIKVNKPVGNVRVFDMNLSNTTACECDPSKRNPCGPDSDCLNRILMTECNPEVCPAGKKCNNQSFEKREYPPLVPYRTQSRGWGLKTLAAVPKGRFVIEYVGEMIDDEEYQRRLRKMHEQKEENYYFLTIDKDRMIDAGPKGNLARFMNHCCQPNCETQKWTVNGDTRVGLFAIEDIPADTELTFNYNLECIGEEKKVCRCGAPNCSGFIGVKPNQIESEYKKPKKEKKKKKPPKPVALPPCFVCKRKGKVIICDNKVCNKAYHAKCLKEDERPNGTKFLCPWHNCNICSKRTIRCCVECTNSFCPSHSESNIRYDTSGFVCADHDPLLKPKIQPRKSVSRRIFKAAEEPSTSTTDEESEDGETLLVRLNRKKKLEKASTSDEESEDDTSLLWRLNCKKKLKKASTKANKEDSNYNLPSTSNRKKLSIDL